MGLGWRHLLAYLTQNTNGGTLACGMPILQVGGFAVGLCPGVLLESNQAV